MVIVNVKARPVLKKILQGISDKWGKVMGSSRIGKLVKSGHYL